VEAYADSPEPPRALTSEQQAVGGGAQTP
jgi:hypothetical protein